MYLNQFSVRIVGGHEVDGGYVRMTHGKQYAIALKNDRTVPCDAEVTIDGKSIGGFRVNANSSMVLQRKPGEDRGRFTFYIEGTSEAAQAQIESGNPSNGLVSVTFTPERKRELRPLTTINLDNADNNVAFAAAGFAVADSATRRTASLSVHGRAGGTGLSGWSNQNFVDVAPLEYDYSGQTTINLRLVAEEVNAIRPLKPASSPVPPYVG